MEHAHHDHKNGGNKIVLAETGNIMEYLLEYFGGVEKGLVPKRFDEGGRNESEEWLRYRYYMHYIEGSLMPNLVFALILERMLYTPMIFDI